MRSLKILVIVMAAILLAGFTVIAGEMVRRLTGSGRAPTAAWAATLDLPAGARILDMAATVDRVVLRVAGPEGESLYLVDPASGALAGILVLGEAD